MLIKVADDLRVAMVVGSSRILTVQNKSIEVCRAFASLKIKKKREGYAVYLRSFLTVMMLYRTRIATITTAAMMVANIGMLSGAASGVDVAGGAAPTDKPVCADEL